MPDPAAVGQNGWCATHRDRGDHTLTPRCANPRTEDEVLLPLERQAAEHDRHVTYSPEAAYVAQHRPH